MVIENTYPNLVQIYQAKFELGRVKQFIPASDHMILSRTVAPGTKSVNMVDWKYSSFFSLDWITGLISRRPSSWNRVQDYGRIERFGGSISFFMHNRKPAAVFPASQRCSEGGQSWCRVRPLCNAGAGAAYPAPALAAL